MQKSNHLSVIFENSTLLHDYGEKLYSCGSFLGFSWDDDASRVTLSRSNFCRIRFCPMCQWRRSRKLGVELDALWKSLLADGYDFLHCVLTVRNIGKNELPSCIDQMQAAYRNMMKDPSLAAWKGAMRFLEVTYSDKSGMYHPHFHSLIIVRKSYYHSRYYVNTDKLRALWQTYLRSDYLPLVYLSKADSHAINEVAKYCVKPFDHDFDDWRTEREVYETLFTALHGRRLYQTFGDVRRHAHAGTDETACDAASCSAILDLSYNYRTRQYEPLPTLLQESS